MVKNTWYIYKLNQLTLILCLRDFSDISQPMLMNYCFRLAVNISKPIFHFLITNKEIRTVSLHQMDYEIIVLPLLHWFANSS